MHQGFKFRAHRPPRALAQTLIQRMGAQRFIYNGKVGEDRYFRQFARKALSLTGQRPPIDRCYSQFKTDRTPWLFEIPSQVLRNGAHLWKEAYARFFKKLSGRPRFKRKDGRRSVWLTRELFEFVEQVDPVTRRSRWFLHLGTQAHRVGKLELRAHRAFTIPASVHVSERAGRWFVSFNTEDGKPELTDEKILAALQHLAPEELRARTVGLDRGVAVPLAASTGQTWDFSPVQRQRIARQAKYRKHWQRKVARRVKGSRRREAAKRRVSRAYDYATNVRCNFAHKASAQLIAGEHSLIVFEDLKIKAMTTSARGTAQVPGKRVAQKTGLNRSILDSAWGLTKTFTHYKARRHGKLCLAVAPHFSSQTCALCQHTHSDNRPSQSMFICQHCEHTDNADINASRVTAQRGVTAVLAGEVVFKKKIAIKRWVGVERPEPAESKPPTHVETDVSHRVGNRSMLRSRKRETLTRTVAV